jgi:hypothetical protein
MNILWSVQEFRYTVFRFHPKYIHDTPLYKTMACVYVEKGWGVCYITKARLYALVDFVHVYSSFPVTTDNPTPISFGNNSIIEHTWKQLNTGNANYGQLISSWHMYCFPRSTRIPIYFRPVANKLRIKTTMKLANFANRTWRFSTTNTKYLRPSQFRLPPIVPILLTVFYLNVTFPCSSRRSASCFPGNFPTKILFAFLLFPTRIHSNLFHFPCSKNIL